MKKKLPKITLHRETLYHLGPLQLEEVAGAAPTFIKCNPPTYTCHGQYTCGGPRCL